MFSVVSLVTLVFLYLFLLRRDAVSKTTWSYFESGFYSAEGRLGAMAVSSLSHCAVECFYHSQCDIFGHNSTDKICILHNGSFTNNQSSAATLKYYKATCGERTDYNYTKSLKKCLKFVNEGMEWEEARVFCEENGGHLVYVKTQAMLDYLSDHRVGVFSKYWLGGTQIEEGSNTYKWLSGEVIDSTSGGQFWVDGRPTINSHSGKMCIESKYSPSRNMFGLYERSCNYTRKFFCESD